MSGKKLSRREMLKILGISAMGTYVAACVAPITAPEAPKETPKAAPTPAGPVTLRLVTWGGTTHAEKRDAAVRSVYPELDEKIKVEFVVGGGGDFDVAQALRLALAAGQDIPDLVQFNRTQIAEFAAAGELLELDEVYGPYKDDLYAGALELVKYEDKIVCFPFELKSKIFHYRADLFEQAGIKVENIKSVADFINVGKAFHQQFPNSYILNLGPQPVQYWIGEIVSAYSDVRMADESGKYLVKEHEAFANAFKFLKEVYDSGISFPIDDWSSDWQQAFANETICGFMCASWVKFFLPKFAPKQGGKWRVDLWPPLNPYLADQRYGSEAGGSVYVVPKRSAHPDLSTEYLTKVFLDKKGAMACFKAVGMTPLMKSAKDELMAAVRSAEKPADMSDEDWATQPTVFFGAEYQELELKSYDYVKVFPYDPSATKEIGILVQWLNKYMANEVELADALAGAQADMESQIGNPYEV